MESDLSDSYKPIRENVENGFKQIDSDFNDIDFDGSDGKELKEMTHIVQRPCSIDGTFEQVDIIPSKMPPPPPSHHTGTEVLVTSRTDPLTREQFQAMMDADGRLISEHALRKAVFLGGVSPDIRKEVWSFLFGLYPCNSTTREREAILIDNIVHYHEMKTRWKTMLVVNSIPGSTPLDQGLYARYQFPEDCGTGSGCDDSDAEQALKARLVPLIAGRRSNEKIDFDALGHPDLQKQYNDPALKQKIDFMRLQAQVQVNRVRVDVKKLRANMRVIDKDVPRTDRDQDYFKGKANPRLGQLREILLTYSAYHDLVGYAQGMNDILSRFLYVMDSEAETYWCFKTYMEKIRLDFMEEGLTRKIDLVRMLLKEMDPALLKHLEILDLGNLFFCHRWLLLGFKREFTYLDSLRCFEILSSHHLELSSLETEHMLHKEEMKEFASTGGDTRSLGPSAQKDYTFEVFMCATVLTECRDELFKCLDCGAAFSFLNELVFDLDSLLTKSERMFFVYCKKTVSDSFQIVDAKVDNNEVSKQSGVKQQLWSLSSLFR